MLKPASRALLGAVFLVGVTPAFAADIYEPPVVEAPPQVVYQEVDTGGWYIRGDLNYHWSKLRGTEYITYGCCGVVDPGSDDFDTTDLDGSWSIGGGVGYQITRYLRTDLTFDYLAGADFTGTTSGVCGGVVCSSTDTSSYDAYLLLANAYVDLGTWHGVTPYVGAGIGGAYVQWDDLRNTIGGVDTVHEGSSEWRFAYALMAGASYCLTQNLLLDVGYRYVNIEGGRMFQYADSPGGFPGAGPGFDDGFNIHEVRGGLRYQFGGGNSACAPQVVAYEPEPLPVYK